MNAIELLGADPAALPPDQRRALDERGYVVLPGLIAGAELDRLRTAFEAAVGGAVQRGTRHAGDLVDAGSAFEVTFTHAAVLAVAWHVLQRPFEVLVLGARDPLPGFGAQGLHTDWRPQPPREPAAVVTALWMLDDFTERNGATRVVPGSHRVPGPVPRSMAAPRRRHPGELRVVAPAGAALVFHGHLWHGGADNASRGPRRAVQCQLVARDLVPPAQRRSGAPDWVSPLGRRVLGLRA